MSTLQCGAFDRLARSTSPPLLTSSIEASVRKKCLSPLQLILMLAPAR